MQQVTHHAPFKAGGAIGAHKIVHVAADGDVEQAVAASTGLIGVTGREATAANDTVEVAVAGIAEVKLGAAVNPGSLVKADANGEAIATSTAGHGIVGICVRGGADGDIGSVLLSQGSV